MKETIRRQITTSIGLLIIIGCATWAQASEKSVSLVTITDLGEMFEFSPPTGSSGTIHMELYELGKEMLVEFALPHCGEPIQVWLAFPINKEKPENYYLRYIFGPAEPSAKWRLVGLGQMPKAPSRLKKSEATGVMPHGDVKDGLAAFLLCHRERFKLGEPVPLTYGIICVGSELGKEKTVDEDPANAKLQKTIWWLRAKPEIRNNYSWFEVSGPDGQNIPYRGYTANLLDLSAAPAEVIGERSVLLHHRQFVGTVFPDLRKNFDLSKPGIYKVRWGYDAPWKGGPWIGKLTSNEVQFEIGSTASPESGAIGSTPLQRDQIAAKIKEFCKEDLAGKRRDELLEELKKENFEDVAEPVLTMMLSYASPLEPPIGTKPWLNQSHSSEAKIRYAAADVWQAHMSGGNDEKKAMVLLRLLDTAETDHAKTIILHSLALRHWRIEAEQKVQEFLVNSNEDLSVREKAAKAVLRRCDINKYFDEALNLPRAQDDVTVRSRCFNNITNLGNKLHSLSPANKQAALDLGFKILTEESKEKLSNGYCTARKLGFLLQVEGEFAPDQNSPKYQGERGLNESFFSDTVVNALKWYKDNLDSR